MRRCVIPGVLTVVLMLTAMDVSAQKYPERREARRGVRLHGKGDVEGAETKYRRAIELQPEFREARFNLAGALWRQAQGAVQEGQSEQEEQQQQQAVQAKAQEATKEWMVIAADSLAPAPMASAAGYNAGNVALSGQQLDAAIEAYKMSLRLRPDDMEAKFNLAYAQKLKQQQEDNKEENKNDQQQDKDGQGGDDQKDQQDDPNRNDQNGDGKNDPEDNKDGQDGENDSSEGDGEQPPQQNGNGGQEREATISPQDAAHMLEAMQGEEDKTREKMNAREVPVAGRSGKNW